MQNKIFLVNQSQLEERIDSHFDKPEFINNYSKVRNIPNKQLRKRIDFSKETWNQKDYFIHQFPYIEIGGIYLKTGEIDNISEIEISDAPKSAKMIVRKNDILISKIRPNRGAICLINKHLDGWIASTGFAVIRKIKNKVNRKYLFDALRLNSTLKQFEQRSYGANYPSITKNELQNTLLPLPPKETQTQIVTFMDYAYALNKQKDKETAQLLSSIDDFVMTTFGIPSLAVKTIFRLMAKDITGQRFDVEPNPYF